MTPGPRTHKQASCRVAIAEGVPEGMRESLREVMDVFSAVSRSGHATALMHQVCAEADKEWVSLLLHVKSFADGMNDEQLKKFYSSFGFEEIQTDPCLMLRSPQPPTIARTSRIH